MFLHTVMASALHLVFFWEKGKRFRHKGRRPVIQYCGCSGAVTERYVTIPSGLKTKTLTKHLEEENECMLTLLYLGFFGHLCAPEGAFFARGPYLKIGLC